MVSVLSLFSLLEVVQEAWYSFPSPLLTLLLWPIVLPILALNRQHYLSLSYVSDDTVSIEMIKWLNRSAVECAIGIRAGEVTSEQLTRACLAQLSEQNPKLNAVVATRHNDAMCEAIKADEALAQGSAPAVDTTNGRLWGVPIVVKECFEQVDMPYTGGVIARRSVRGQKDAPIITSLKEAGLIIIASTNISEACSK